MSLIKGKSVNNFCSSSVTAFSLSVISSSSIRFICMVLGFFLSLGNGGVGSSTSSSSQFISLKNGWSFMLATSFLRVFGSLHRSCEGKENGETLDDRNGIKLLRGLFIKICGVHSPHITGNTPHSAGNLHPINKMLSTMWTLRCVLCIKLAKNACS